MDLITIFRILYRKIWYLVAIPAIVVVLTFILTSGYKRIFRSAAQLSTGFTISQEVNVTAQRFNLYEADVKFSNLIETMMSSRVLSLLSYRTILHDLEADENDAYVYPDMENEKNQAILQSIDLEQVKLLCREKLDSMQILNTHIEEDKKIQELLEVYGYDYESLKDIITVKRVKNTDYVAVNAFTENPFLSAFIVNTLCSEFLRFNSNLVGNRKRGAVQIFTRLLEEKRKELNLAVDRLQKFKQYNSMVNFEFERENKVSRISELQLELENEKKNYRSITLQLEDVNNRLKGFIGNSELITNWDVLEIRKQINAMNVRYQASNGTNRVLEDSLQILREIQQRYIRVASLGSTGNSYDEIEAKKQDLKVEQQIASQNIQALEANINSASTEAGGFASKEARIDALEREVNMTNEDYKEAQDKYSQAINVSMASGNSIVQILLGLPASEPEPSKRVIVSGLAGASVFVLIILTIILLEYVDVSIKNRSNFNRLIDDVELIGVTNNINLKKADAFSISDQAFNSKNRNRKIFRDQLRKLRFSIVNSEKKVILVTSTKDFEGKTLLIQSLSKALSQSKFKVLIIDTNFKNNELTTVLGANTLFESVISGKQSEAANLIKKTEHAGIDIIGSEGGDYSPVEVVNNNFMTSLISKLKKNYDFILLEGTSLNGNSDSRELSEFVDGVISVFSAKSILGHLDYESIEFLKNLGDKFIGAVLNNVELRDMEN